MSQAQQPGVGDYVLATKYEDGDPGDHWVVGYLLASTMRDRYDVGDAEGHSFRANGFRRVEPIAEMEGLALLVLYRNLARRNVYAAVWDYTLNGLSVWDRLRLLRTLELDELEAACPPS